LRLQIGEKTVEPIKGDYMLIPRGVWHRMGTVENWDQPARVLEVSFGEYDQVGDIERKDDRYGRVHLDGSI
jgi:mannose-6-phosphate isomerase-like protein (cupin superfamily)